MERIGCCGWWVVLLSTLTVSAALTADFTVISYTASLTFLSNTTVGSNVSATAIIQLLCNNASAPIVLNWGSSLIPESPTTDVVSVALSTDPATNITIAISQDAATETITLSPTETLTESSNYNVTINYQTTVNADTKGIFIKSYQNGNNSSSFLAGNAWPTYARDILPCLDQPDLAPSTWQLIFVRPSAWTLAASLPFTSLPEESTGFITDTLSSASGVTLPPSSLSFFFNMGDFVETVYLRGQSATNFTFWARTELNGTTSLANNISMLAQLFYAVDDVLSTNFTLTDTVNVILVPNLPQPFSGLGIIFIREDFYTADFTSVQSRGLLNSLLRPVLYQYIRQYSLFSSWPAAWQHYWISEAIGGFLEYTTLANLWPEVDLVTELQVVVRQSALALDSATSSAPLNNSDINVESTAAIQASIKDPLNKLKGTSLLNMVDMSFPAGLVMEAIQTLLGDKGKSVTSDQLINLVLTQISSSGHYLSAEAQGALNNLTPWFNTSGFPLLTSTVNTYGTSGSVDFSLSAFCDLSPCGDLNVTYNAPATIGTKSEPRTLIARQDIWVVTGQNTTASVQVIDGDWIASNMHSSAYYRVNYPTSNWELLQESIATNASSIPEISQIFDDSMALAHAGFLSYNISLRLITANLNLQHYKYWYPIYTNLWKLKDNLMDTESYPEFQTFAKALLQNVANILEGGTLSDTEREKTLALVFEGMCEFDVSGYRTQAANLLTDLLNGILPSTIGSASYDAVVCCGSQYSSSLNTSLLLSAIANSSANFYVRHFNAIALGCLNDSSTQIASLLPGTNTTISTSDFENKPYISTVYQYMAEVHPKDFVANLSSFASSLQNLLGAPTLASLIIRSGEKINNATIISQLSTLLNSTGTDDFVKSAVTSSITSASLRATWLSNNNASLTSAFESNTVVVSSANTFYTKCSVTFLLPLLFIISILHDC